MVSHNPSNEVWLNWNDLNKRIESKRVVFFGRGTWMGKTSNYLSKDGDYAVDNSRYEQGTIEKGLNVNHPEVLKKENKNEIFIVITTSAFKEVIDQLESYGFIPGEHFCVSPSLKGFSEVSRITNHSQTIYIACSDSYIKDSEERGGGFYSFNTESRQLIKIVNGLCHSIVEGNGYKFLIDDIIGVRVLDKDFSTIEKIKLPPKTRPHGIAFCPKRNLIFISFTGFDSIGIYDATNLKKLDEVAISTKIERLGVAQHHINDLCVINDTLYVSMFSLSGNWRLGIYDGGIIEFDIESRQFKTPILTDRWMPHSPVLVGENLLFCDSMRGSVNCGTWKTLMKFNGFVRGLAFDNQFYYVGHSMHRHIHRVENTNISIDTGIFMFNESSKVSKFFQIPQLSDIHALYIPKQ